jgi:hypothetical protein
MSTRKVVSALARISCGAVTRMVVVSRVEPTRVPSVSRTDRSAPHRSAARLAAACPNAHPPPQAVAKPISAKTSVLTTPIQHNCSVVPVRRASEPHQPRARHGVAAVRALGSVRPRRRTGHAAPRGVAVAFRNRPQRPAGAGTRLRRRGRWRRPSAALRLGRHRPLRAGCKGGRSHGKCHDRRQAGAPMVDRREGRSPHGLPLRGRRVSGERRRGGP